MTCRSIACSQSPPAVVFYALPALAVAVSLFGLFADPDHLTNPSASLNSVLPAEAAKLV
jgi:hypothetical protein